MKMVIDIEDYDREWINNAYCIPNEINSKIADAIIDGTPLSEYHEDLVEMKCVDKCFICGKEIQRNSIPRIEEPKIDKIMLSEDKEEHLVCDTFGNLLTVMYKMLKNYNG